MGSCFSTSSVNPPSEEKSRSDSIDRRIDADSRALKKECKILLLGSGESGKSTIVKQMKIIHQNGFTNEELLVYRPVVNGNLVEVAKGVLGALDRMGVELDEVLEPHVRIIRSYEESSLYSQSTSSTSLPPSLGQAIAFLWSDPSVQALVEHRFGSENDSTSEFYLIDSAEYFLSNATRICSEGYVPNSDDVLRSRAKTTGITETKFSMGRLNIHMFDVGGQRSERRKWIHCFESVTSIIFCVALSEYDQFLLEESSQNRMRESLALFDGVVNSRWFFSTSIILFLNKKDVFQQKIKRVPLEKYFPEYAGGPDMNKAAKFILWKFSQANRARLSIYPHLTQATDTDNIRLVFMAVKETILHNALKDAGIV